MHCHLDLRTLLAHPQASEKSSKKEELIFLDKRAIFTIVFGLKYGKAM
ncbi:predicted protein [Sclerotinia sclerotiorum 1980 UF-70]|uniref:Uncharacterized protein n=1 Tax=Sclerotinia sclerotiorum (strain ATCC 18683 / 1980 / Ss-1) TaxID=665079 RepID=A7E6C2_SCLS1|nr:predicted protein [Sclerotinia sclerotiorum 1980 UF-70]EDN91444.1 predicted protein [Sclerotinia sclerotiorum 1980 UF-70]